MLKQKKFWILSLSLGVTVGAVYIVFIRDLKLDSNHISFKISTSKTPSRGNQAPVITPITQINPAPDNAVGLKVSNQPGNQGLINNNDLSTESSPTPTDNNVPGPASFSQYEQYKTDTSALYADLIVGTGAPIVTNSTVTVQYRGWLTNGTEFDESYSRGQAFSFVEGQNKVITGWEEGLLGMRVGGTRRLIIPPSVGYGDTAQGSIPANSVLIFDVQLISVN